MENQTRYDLNPDIENWRHELAAQANLTVEVRRELKTHLRDALAGFQQRGLSGEESFWLARRRVGHPQQLDEEFVKANPAAVWRQRILWMAVALLIVSLWTTSAGLIDRMILDSINRFAKLLLGTPQSFPLSFQITFALLLRTSPFFVLVFFLLRGTGRIILLLDSVFQARLRLIFLTLPWLAVNEGCLVSRWLANNKRYMAGNGPSTPISYSLISTLFWPLALIVLIAWLTAQDRRIPKHT